MATNINLLPLDMSASRQVLKGANLLKRISVMLAGVLTIILVLGVALIIFFKIQINSSTSREQSLKQNIQSLQGTEQKLFFIKDRTEKISQAFKETNAFDQFDMMNKTLAILPAGTSVDSVKIDSLTSTFAVLSTNSLDMASFLNNLVTSGIYKKLTLKNFIFTPDRGYLITLQSS
ncbi:MAG TPA: hypothetical protein VLE44_00850 [Candidatus Saccharimonadales bacterium]|nr:hypothetical protein [Candidatus Saccharimonadales bacterium]